ncbi:MAG TPA: hypothetical protein VD902_21205 [Symbiobacteriaceae bacterium]|nr:hypothetical protein [Symbiobacteriaceae bacterium]
MRGWLALLLVSGLLAGCRAGTAPQELEQLRARVSTLEAENAHLRGQLSLVESERDQLSQQVNTLATDLAKAEGTRAAGGGGGDTTVIAGQNLVVVPRQVRPGEWIAVYVRNYPARLLPQAGVALRGKGDANLAHVKRLAAANLFLLPVPQNAKPGDYRVVIGEAGELGPGAKLDDQVGITVVGR